MGRKPIQPKGNTTPSTSKLERQKQGTGVSYFLFFFFISFVLSFLLFFSCFLFFFLFNILWFDDTVVFVMLELIMCSDLIEFHSC